jgi:hypothetical protein
MRSNNESSNVAIDRTSRSVVPKSYRSWPVVVKVRNSSSSTFITTTKRQSRNKKVHNETLSSIIIITFFTSFFIKNHIFLINKTFVCSNMSKIPIKRMYDVIAELQKESSSSSSSSSRVPPNTTKYDICSRLAANLVSHTLSNSNKRVKLSHDSTMNTVGAIRKDDNHATHHPPNTTTALPSPSDESSTPSHLSHVPEAIVQLREVYLYGLGQVSKLQDLQHAPDAILPGNIVYEDEYETALLSS